MILNKDETFILVNDTHSKSLIVHVVYLLGACFIKLPGAPYL